MSCTQTIDFGPISSTPIPAPSEDPGKVLCWRTSQDLSVAVLVLGTDPSYVPTAAAAVKVVWDLQG